MRMWTIMLVGAAAIALLLYGPIAQPEDYHAFADRSVLWGGRGQRLGDHAIFALIAPISGHTLKHLLAALGAWVIVRAQTEGHIGRDLPARVRWFSASSR